MEDTETKKPYHHKANPENIPWKAWSKWSSWESPIGLSLGYGISIVSTGVFIYLLHLSGIIK